MDNTFFIIKPDQTKSNMYKQSYYKFILINQHLIGSHSTNTFFLIEPINISPDHHHSHHRLQNPAYLHVALYCKGNQDCRIPVGNFAVDLRREPSHLKKKSETLQFIGRNY